MKRLLLAVALLTAFPCATMAQVEKQVEVTKAYVPKVEQAAKLAIEPDMTDTVQMRPEIDYTITPLSLETTLDTRPIRPASVTYWEFNRPLLFYLKVGAGYPLNSVLDFYAATQNPDTGYALGYINHKGRYADIRNCFDVKNNSLWMENRAGVAAGTCSRDMSATRTACCTATEAIWLPSSRAASTRGASNLSPVRRSTTASLP